MTLGNWPGLIGVGKLFFIRGGQQLLYTPSPPGAQLFLWAHGEGQRIANDIINADLVFNTKNFSKCQE
jgi:hypothetical protein